MALAEWVSLIPLFVIAAVAATAAYFVFRPIR